MRRWVLSSILVVLLATYCIGCGERYFVGKESFSSTSEALKRQNETFSQVLGTITPTDKPAHGTALVLHPSDTDIHKNYIKYAYNASHMSKEGIDYLTAFTRNGHQFVADAIRKKEIFDSVVVERHNGNPAFYPIRNFDFLIFRDIDGWFIKNKDKPRPEPILTNDLQDPVAFLNYLALQANTIHDR
jgi:hypothetical protein